MRDLLGKFWTHFSHLDSKFIKMVWHLLVPAKVSLAYFNGKKHQYPHPVQFFFIVMFFFLLITGKALGDMSIQSSEDEEKNRVTFSAGPTKNAKKGISAFESMRAHVERQKLHSAYDSLPARLRVPSSKEAIDSAITIALGPPSGIMKSMTQVDQWDSTSHISDTLPISFFRKRYNLAIKDIVEMEPEDLMVQYGITKWHEKLLIKQSIKAIRDPQAYMRNLIGSIGWSLLMFVGVMALFFKLLYIRSRKYYVEHFIFLLHHVSGDLVLLTLAVLFSRFVPEAWLGVLGFLLFLWAVRNLYIAIRRFYGQGWIKTGLKWTFVVFSTLPIFAILFALSSILILFIF